MKVVSVVKDNAGEKGGVFSAEKETQAGSEGSNVSVISL
jgi:hypothetical protein